MTPKRPRDPNQLAKSIIDIAPTGKSLTATHARRAGKDPLRSHWARRAGRRGWMT